MSSAEPIALKPRRRRRAHQPFIYIDSITLQKLFGKISYDSVPINELASENNRVSVIYGDNGSGKTTILRLIYACLSPQPRMGLRTIVSKTPFLHFSIKFSDGSTLSVDKTELVGGFSCKIRGFGINRSFSITSDGYGNVRGQQVDVAELENALATLGFDILFVDHNRVVQSTYSFITGQSDPEVEFSYEPEALETGEISVSSVRRVRRRSAEQDLQFPLPQVIDALERGFRTQAFRQGAEGEQSAAAVYLEIVKTLNRDRRKSNSSSAPQIQDLIGHLNQLKDTSSSFIRHGLLSDYPFDDLISIYSSSSKAKKASISTVLSPFLDSIQRRIGALTQVHNLITIFEFEMNRYFKDKSISFHILEGLQITDENGRIPPDILSSGEKQLVFLLCAAAISRSRRSIILIDEPELSLNYKWQRLIAGSLANIAAGGGTQYILASHSIEIITRYSQSSYELVAS